MAIFATYDAIGNKECLLDVISNISPQETPFFSRFGKVQIDGVHPEWQTDSLRSAAVNKQVQGYSYTAVIGAVVPTARIGNYSQILSVGYEVSKTQDAVAKAGRASEVAYQKTKAMKEFALDAELMLAVNATAVAPAAGTAGQAMGVPGFITTNVIDAGSGTVDITEPLLENLLETAWTAGATEMNAIYCGAYQKRRINGFPGTNRQMAQAETTYKNVVNVYESDFGTLEIILDRRVATDDIYVLSDNMWKVGVLRPVLSAVALPDSRSADAFVIEGELSLICYNEKANAKYVDLKNA